MKPIILSILVLAAAVPSPARPAGGDGPAAPSPTPAALSQAVSGGFTRYIPNKEGDYEWKLEGESAVFLSSVSLEVIRLTATALTPRLEGLTIEAGKMLYFTDSGIARHDEARIVVRRENSVLTGRGFIWTSENGRIRIFEDVRFLIREEGQGGLFPL